MFGPALANILTRLITHEGKADLFLTCRISITGPLGLLAAGLVPARSVHHPGRSHLLRPFPHTITTPSLGLLRQQLAAAGFTAGNVNPWLIVVTQTLQAILLAPLLNAICHLWGGIRLAGLPATQIDAARRPESCPADRCDLGRLALAGDPHGL